MKKILLSLPLILLLVACVNVPMTTILVPTERGVVTIKAPKDSRIENLKANFEKGTVSFDHYEARMNPDVVSASAAGQAELIKGYTELANSLGQLGMRAFAASQGIPLGNLGPTAPATPQVSQTITTEQLNAIVEKRAQDRAQQIIATQSTNPPPATLHGPRNRPVPAPASTNAPPINH